jgi:glycosyltransferase involved in cell wall biosynthesis
MKILLVTDHRFYLYQSHIYDVFRIDQEFFKDYSDVFSEVRVLARLIDVDSLPQGANRSDSQGVYFVPGIKVAQRFFWVITSKVLNYPLIQKEIEAADGVIIRVPSELGSHAAQEALRQNKPLLAEVVGDPEESIGNQSKGGLHYKVLASWEDYLLRRIIRHVSAASYVSRFSLQKKYPVSPGVYNDNISSVRLDEADISQPRDYSSTHSPLRIVYLANLIPHKRHIDLIKAVEILLKRGVEVEVHFAGDGFIKENLIQATKRIGLEAYIHFHGHISEKREIFRLLDNSDLFVFPSASEGIPRAGLEGMARGLPIIGSNAGGIPEIVRESEIFRVGDVKAIVELIQELIHDPQRLTDMSHYSIRTAEEFTGGILSAKRRKLYSYFRDCIVQKGNHSIQQVE